MNSKDLSGRGSGRRFLIRWSRADGRREAGAVRRLAGAIAVEFPRRGPALLLAVRGKARA